MPRPSSKRHEDHNVLGTTKSVPVERKRLCQREECQPWTKKEDLPGRDYKTSARRSHPHLHPYFTGSQALIFEVPERIDDGKPYKPSYQSSYGAAYTRKCDCSGGSDKVNTPHSLKYSMLYSWAERLRNTPVRKKPELLTEMKDKYKLHLADETSDCRGVVNDLKPHVICKVHAVAKDAQSKTFSEEKCVQKVMDPYISRYQYDFINFSSYDKGLYKHKKAEPEELIVHREFPMFDQSFVRMKFLDRFIRKKIPPVPHSGMTTEVRDNYKLPINEFAHIKQPYCSSLVPLRQTKGEVMSIPAMYHTDYSHYGQDWPISSILG